VTCYHLISGRPPFHGETALSIAVQHLNEPAAPLKKRRPDLPHELCDLVHRMMEKDPGKRPADAKELKQEIKKIPEQVTANEQRSWRSWVPFQGDQLFRKQLLMFLFVSLCLGGVSAAVGWVNRPGDPLNAPFAELETGSSDRVVIPEKKSPMTQFLLAVKLRDSEDAWKAVITNFPEDEFYKSRAQIRLGLILISESRYVEARAVFQKLIDSNQAVSLVNGYAGLLALESIRGNARKSQDIWGLHIESHLDDLDTEMADYVDRALRKNQNVLGIDNKEHLDRLFDLSVVEEGTVD
jgi:eukaryotic-like serine/threonine-protein kinase